MVREGLSAEDATRRFWCVDREGLLIGDMGGQGHDHKVVYARPVAESLGWARDANGNRVSLAEVVSRMGGHIAHDGLRETATAERHIILALCRPAALAAANPADLPAWTDRRALIATGSVFAPVTYKGVTHVIGQVNNAMLYPGLCLGTIVSRASRISEGMFAAAASAVSSLLSVRQPGASLLPHVDDLLSVSATVAVAVAEAAQIEGLARVRFDDIVQQVRDAMWQPEYRRIQATGRKSSMKLSHVVAIEVGVRIAGMVNWLWGCAHRRTTFPITLRTGSGEPAPPQGMQTETYIVCLDCGRHLPYDWTTMQITEGRLARVAPPSLLPSLRESGSCGDLSGVASSERARKIA